MTGVRGRPITLGRIRALPRNKAGYPIPFFVETVDGQPDFRVMSLASWWACVRDRRCWICGQRRAQGQDAFVIGPMCAVNRVTSEPPAHLECAEFAAVACPFLANPNMVRRTTGLPGEVHAAGTMIRRNPGVTLIWVTPKWELFTPANATRWSDKLFDLGDPTAVSWWSHGRTATRDEVLASIESGMPLLRGECDTDPDPAAAHADLDRKFQKAMRYVPDTPEGADGEGR